MYYFPVAIVKHYIGVIDLRIEQCPNLIFYRSTKNHVDIA